jgi:hypothetical protein
VSPRQRRPNISRPVSSSLCSAITFLFICRCLTSSSQCCRRSSRDYHRHLINRHLCRLTHPFERQRPQPRQPQLRHLQLLPSLHNPASRQQQQSVSLQARAGRVHSPRRRTTPFILLASHRCTAAAVCAPRAHPFSPSSLPPPPPVRRLPSGNATWSQNHPG